MNIRSGTTGGIRELDLHFAFEAGFRTGCAARRKRSWNDARDTGAILAATSLDGTKTFLFAAG